MADNLGETELRENIAEIIKNGDLGSLTSKKIRQILEKKYDVNLLHRKKQIDDIVMQLVDEQSDDSDENGSAGSASKVDSGKSMKEESSEPETKSPVKSERVSVITTNKRKKKVKAESDSDAEEDLQSESESDSDYDAPKPKRKSSPTKRPAKNKEKGKVASKKPKAEKGEGVKKKTGFSTPMLLSPELAELMGETHMPRSEVVKKMWQIIKERDLLDPTNKRFTICDDQLQKIIGKKRFLTFAMMKYLKKHVKDPAMI